MRFSIQESNTVGTYGALFGFLLIWSMKLKECNGIDKYKILMNSHRQEHLTVQSRAQPDYLHEIVFAVNQKNTENLEAALLDRSTPEHSLYQKWMTFEEVGEFTSNPYGAGMIKEWLRNNNATITWESIHNDYIKATASIQIWEYLFDTIFYEWHDTGKSEYFGARGFQSFNNLKNLKRRESEKLILATEYTIPEIMRRHMGAAFNTVQVRSRFFIFVSVLLFYFIFILYVFVFVRNFMFFSW